MQVIKVKKGDLVVRRQDKVMAWYLIQIGSVSRHYNFAEITMVSNSIIGILENEWFSCDYVALEDTTLIVIPCTNATDIRNILKSQPNFRPIFLRTALEQRHQALCLYSSLKKKATLLHTTAQSSYNDYKTLCHDLVMPERDFYRFLSFEALVQQHRVENWEIASSNSLMKEYLKDYMQLMTQSDDLCVGAIMEASAQMHRTALGIEEIDNYLLNSRDVLWNDKEDDVFHLYFYLAMQLASQGKDLTSAKEHMKELCATMQQLGIYDELQIQECTSACENYQFSTKENKQEAVSRADCVSHIMSYAGYDKPEIRKFKLLLDAYKKLPDRASMEKDARSLRKNISKQFYEIYTRAFFHSLIPGEQLSTILQMFFYFGFMDAELLGPEQTDALGRFSQSLGLFHYEHIYTIYDWLKGIFRGEIPPSRNDLDMDFVGHLQQQLKVGDIDEKQFSKLRYDPSSRVEFEISNLFQLTHKAVCDHPSSFCPILTSEDVFGSFEKMAVTAARLIQSMNTIRGLDYSAFYREVMFSDTDHGVNQEWLMKEILPDVILMPGVGSRSVMWQETGDVRTDTPARFIFPIFINSDLDEQMQLCVARYRWEICRRVQGTYWNDFRVKSLTSEYYDYLQFYRKNKDLSGDAKDKLKNALGHARNNFREVFVADYINWLRYESQGSFRLNKIARDILVRYCPFSKEIRAGLTSNPLYQNAFNRLELENKKKISRLQAFYTKYEASGGTITPDLNENLRFYEM
jgi:hypothetical protein